MNQEVKTKWLEALRSGKYAQTTGHLVWMRDGEPEGYCCLGVLCDLAMAEGIVERTEDPTPYRHNDEHPYFRDPKNINDRSNSILPFAVSEWAGLGAGNPNIPVEIMEEAFREAGADEDSVEAILSQIHTDIASINDVAAPHGPGKFKPTFEVIAKIIEAAL